MCLSLGNVGDCCVGYDCRFIMRRCRWLNYVEFSLKLFSSLQMHRLRIWYFFLCCSVWYYWNKKMFVFGRFVICDCDCGICWQKVALAGRPDILVSTPGGILKCLNLGVLQGKQIQDSLSVLVLDEVISSCWF